MPAYASLLLPSANRVYAAAAGELMRAELAVANETVLGGRLGSVGPAELGGVGYVTFETDRELDETDLAYLGRLSSLYALFAREGELLRPLALPAADRFDDDLVTIPKYTGKTNESFTKLLLNVTVLSSGSAARMLTGGIRVLDPLCGRGTTLNQALLDGYHATGVDIDGKDFEAYAAFLRSWLKRKRLPHKAEIAPLRRDRKLLGRRFDVTVGRTRDGFKAGEVQHVTMACADTQATRRIFAAGSFDVAVADLPYGVQHGSRGPSQQLSRNPTELLAAALPAWVEVLRTGGALGLSWNTHVAARAELATLLAGHGLAVCDSAAYHGFGHRVDQAIDRDLIVARKP